jgi:hypothetical protein
VNKINDASVLAIGKLGDTLLHQTKPGQPAIILATSLFTIAVQKHFTDEFSGTRLAFPNQITEFAIPGKLNPIQGPFVSSKVSGLIV